MGNLPSCGPQQVVQWRRVTDTIAFLPQGSQASWHTMDTFPPYIPYLYRGLSCLNSSTFSSPSHMVHLACAIHHNTDPHDNCLKPIVHASLLILQLYNFFIALLYHNITNRENYNGNFSHLFFKVVHRKLIGKKVWMLLELISRGWPRKGEHVCRYYGHETVIVMVDCRSKMHSVAV